MKQQDFGVIFYDLFKDLEKTLSAKKADYATEDVLSNFKIVSKLAKVFQIEVNTPIGYACFMVLMKFHRICNLLFINRSEPKNESVYDSFKDMIGYAILALALHKEEVEEDEWYEKLLWDSPQTITVTTPDSISIGPGTLKTEEVDDGPSFSAEEMLEFYNQCKSE